MVAHDPNPLSNDERRLRQRQARLALVSIICCCAAFSFVYRLLTGFNLGQTSALFIGLPTFLAIALTLSPPARSATGMALKGTTIALFISGILLGEGLVCILMAAPLFYGVAIFVGLSWDVTVRMRRPWERQGRGPWVLFSVAMTPLLVMSFEGVTPGLSFSREETIEVVRVITASPEAVEASLTERPVFDQALHPFFHLGFPLPVATEGSGLQPGDQRVIHFAGGEGAPGALTLEISARDTDSVTFSTVSDTSHIAHWLAWQASSVHWRAVDADHTEVRWVMHYRRDLDPAWYFGPAERYAVRLAATELIEQIATPSTEPVP